MPKPGDTIKDYKLSEYIGHGSFGEVWLGEKRVGGSLSSRPKKFALKILYGRDGKGIKFSDVQKEVDASIAAHGHPNILSIEEGFIEAEQFIIVSEYASGGSLGDWIEDSKLNGIKIDTAVEMMRGILEGLDHLHSIGFVHRDLKPQNILLQGRVPRIADFGTSRSVGDQSHSQRMAGSLPYMSPEAFKMVTLPCVDIWSAGVILYRLLSGGYPYHSSNGPSLMKSIESAEPTALPASVPLELSRVVARALQKDPSKRYTTSREMLDDLNDSYAMWKLRLRSLYTDPISEHQSDIDSTLDDPYFGQQPEAAAKAKPWNEIPRPEPIAEPIGGTYTPHDRTRAEADEIPFTIQGLCEQRSSGKAGLYLAGGIVTAAAILGFGVLIWMMTQVSVPYPNNANRPVNSVSFVGNTRANVAANSFNPSPTPIPNYDIPDYKAFVSALKLFESPETTVPQELRKYVSAFDKVNTRYVGFELDLNAERNPNDRSITIESVWLKNGQEWKKKSSAWTIAANTDGAFIVDREGSSSVGSWESGKYTLELRYKGRRIASHNFQVVYDEPSIAGQWYSPGWGDIRLEGSGKDFAGSYTKDGPGNIELSKNGEGQYSGKWWGAFGGNLTATLSLDGNTLNVRWNRIQSEYFQSTWVRKR